MVLVNMFAVGWIPYDNNANDLFPSRLRFQEALTSNPEVYTHKVLIVYLGVFWYNVLKALQAKFRKNSLYGQSVSLFERTAILIASQINKI